MTKEMGGERPLGTPPSAAGRSPSSFASLGEGASRLRRDPFASAESVSPFTGAGRTGRAPHGMNRPAVTTPVETTVTDF